ncbi:MAG: bifunctional metallophosphatase/5'-nucleotidase [Bacillota bacterium]
MVGSSLHAAKVDFTILHTNDEHSELVPHSPYLDYGEPDGDQSYGGMARLAGAINQIKKEREEPVLIFNAGDFIGGTPFSWLMAEGQSIELNLLQEMGYDAVVPGNHEFDYGVDELIEYLEGAGYPEALDITSFLSSNLASPQTSSFSDYHDKERIIEMDNVKVGLFGLLGREAFSFAPDTGELELLDPVATAQTRIASLHEKGADIIVAISHSGLKEDEELAQEVEGLDLIVGGHSHDVISSPIKVEDTYIVQTGAYLEYLGVMDLSFDSAEDKLTLVDYNLLKLDQKISPDQAVAEQVESYRQQLNQIIATKTGGRFQDIAAPIARCAFPLLSAPSGQETPMGNLIVDAIRLTVSDIVDTEVDIAFIGSGQIRGGIQSGSRGGVLSVYDLIKPASLGSGPNDEYGYPIAGFYLTGDEVLTLLEIAAFIPQVEGPTHFIQFSGVKYSYNPENTILFTLPIIELPLLTTRAVVSASLYTGPGYQTRDSQDYQDIDPDKLYFLATDSYVLSRISLVEEYIPWLDLKPRDEMGNPIALDQLDDLIISGENGNFKTWEALLYYTDKFNNTDGQPGIPADYAEAGGRINQVDAISYAEIIGIILLMIIAVLSIFKFRQSKK